MASSDPVLRYVSGARRRARAEAARSESVWVRLSPDEAAVIGAAAARAGTSVGAWVGETAVGRARAEAAGDDAGEAYSLGLSSWRELVAALVALRAEVAPVRRTPRLGPIAPAVELSDQQPADDLRGGDGDGDGVVGVLRRIDAVTAIAVDAASSSARRSPRAGREHAAQS